MPHYLVIVESPAKAKTIGKYLGEDYQILASYGHVRDLLKKNGAIDVDHDFEMKYHVVEKNEKHVTAITSAMKKADALYLATDPDREGEAISWHIYALLKEKKALGKKPVHRVVFHEVTKQAVRAAIDSPREISMDLVNAQQARRALDYLVGFNLSPLLWKKIRYGLSAGRVQSPALRLIVEREEEIEKFIPEEYWDVAAKLNIDHNKAFSARLTHYQNEKLNLFSINNEAQASSIRKTLLDLAKGKLTVHHVDKKERKRNPAAPFITSTLQQEAARKLGFSVQRTMRLAQQLYEGVALEQGSAGLISYMRTDSVNLSQEAISEIRELILEKYGQSFLPNEPRVYKTKAKNAQEAHEAIRPTSANRLPEQVQKYLNPDQFRLYELIWKRTVACQMESAVLDTVAVDFKVGTEANLFRSNGSTVKHPGFMKVYQEGKDDVAQDDMLDEMLLPELFVGDIVNLNEIVNTQHFTEPPPRYSEATLIKALEEDGIGRPSTYASIVSTLQARSYVELNNKRFYPTDVGRIVNRFLTQYFTKYVDYDFTAKLEDELDAVSRGEKTWIPLLKEFWSPFKSQVDMINTTVKRQDVTHEELNEKCPECEKPLSIRLGKRGRFVGCTGFPECNYTRQLNADAAQPDLPPITHPCPDCGSELKYREGPYGRFIGCSNYPKCKFIDASKQENSTGVDCPECNQGKIVKRQSKRKRIFFSCSRYPDCKYALWNEPIAKACPKCAWPLMTIKVTKRRGTEHVCPRAHCAYVEAVDEKEGAKK